MYIHTSSQVSNLTKKKSPPTVHSLTSHPRQQLSHPASFYIIPNTKMRAFFAHLWQKLIYRPEQFPVRLISALMIYPVGHLGNLALQKYFDLKNERREAAALEETRIRNRVKRTSIVERTRGCWGWKFTNVHWYLHTLMMGLVWTYRCC